MKVHACLGKHDRLDKEDVGDGREGGNASEDFAAQHATTGGTAETICPEKHAS